MTDNELILEYTGWSSFNHEDWRDVMNLLSKIENSQSNYAVWAEVTPSTTRIVDENRNTSGERLRGSDDLFMPIITYQACNKERDKKRHITEACVAFIKEIKK